jgi:DNA polymerase-3 subunit delta'
MGFARIVGQERAVAVLKRAIEQGRLPHGLLFTGPQGVGRFLTAVTVAKALNCLGDVKGDACDQCLPCRKIEKGVHPDVHVFTPDGATIKIDQVRDLMRETTLKPYEGRRKVFLVDQAETMTEQGQNALLKTLEEPPGAPILILIAPQAQALLPTVVSRCREVRFSPLPEGLIAAKLQEEGCDASEAQWIAAMAGGSLGKAQELRGGALSEARELVVATFSQLQGKTSSLLDLAERLAKEKETLPLYLESLLAWCRDLVILKVTDREGLLVYGDTPAPLQKQREQLTRKQLLAMYQTVGQTLEAIQRYANPRLSLEVMFLKLRDLVAT